MIEFKSKQLQQPIKILKNFYEKAIQNDQSSVEAFCLSTCSENLMPSSRYVNIKYITQNELVFFSNYESKKAKQIEVNNNISGVFFWNQINIQVRLEGKIRKLSSTESDKYFLSRKLEKNALSISSNQSTIIKNYSLVHDKYMNVLNDKELLNKRPKYWGGYKIIPSYFEFWEGHKNRINKRVVYMHKDNQWVKYYLEP